MTSNGPRSTVVYLVVEENAVREGFARMLRSAALSPKPYPSAAEFLSDVHDGPDAVVLLDITLPCMAACDVQRQLRERGIKLPVIVISARDDGPWARSLGAALFLRKPVDDQALLDAIEWVLG